ncbi:MAG TPA: MBL fold metallo-hydrolase [Thermoanaerobaculia bacterium]|nr:MBL fold metallo-hydrolase [Thermoanaerobaculia bacterium]
MPENVFFRDDVLVEPLFNQWYAWTYLIPPASASMYVANLHLELLESFVAMPQMHATALQNPANVGAPFVNIHPSRVDEVRELLEFTREQEADLIELAAAIKTVERKLAAEASGFSLESWYPRLPEPLRGHVELVYDLQGRPSVRFLEGLLYRSRYYDARRQSVALSRLQNDGRTFVFSTPRLRDGSRTFADVAFADPALDELFRARTEAQSYERLRDLLRIDDCDEPAFRTLFTSEPQRACAAYDGADVRVRYFGHACILIEARGVSILCDPVISYKDASGLDQYIHSDLPPVIDYVLITHNHQDHIMFETMLQLRHKVRNVVVPKSYGGHRLDPSLRLLLRTIGFPNVIELDDMETIDTERAAITGLPFLGEHGDLDVRTKLGYHVAIDGRTILLLADSNNVDHRLYEHLRELVGPIDVLFIGMECDGAPISWMYGPMMTSPLARENDQSRRLSGSDCERGMSIVDTLEPKQIYVYAMGQEPWLTFLTSIRYTAESRPIVESDQLVAACRARGLESERLWVKKEIFLPARSGAMAGAV